MQYAFLIGSIFLFLTWLLIFLKLKLKESKTEMIKVSLVTSLLGLTEPIFVPKYWNPPTIFDLAQKIGFDIESLIFAFAVGGIAASAYEVVNKVNHEKLTIHQIHHPRHKFHLFALLSAPVSFLFLYIFTPFNPIYSTIIALLIGALATFYCRPDLIKKMITSGIIFLVIYFVFFLIFNLIFPDYTRQVWNLNDISGILIFGIPLEELIFGFGLGLIWSSVYEHLTWQKIERQ